MSISRLADVLDPDGSLHINRQALRDALYSTSGYTCLTCSTASEFGDLHFAVYR